jgi:putative glutamine amidotransferase
MHPIKLLEDKKLCTTLGFDEADAPFVLSSHHQAVNELGQGIEVTALSTDGKIIEAIEHQTYPNVLGVQFHPEYHTLWDKDLKSRLGPDDEEISCWQVLEENPPSFKFHKKLWSWFIEKLKESNSKRHEMLP